MTYSSYRVINNWPIVHCTLWRLLNGKVWAYYAGP